MMAVNLDEIIKLSDQLPLADKVRLLEHLAPRISKEYLTGVASPRKSLRGLWKGVDITEEDIAEVRREMWAGFPRDDV